MGYRRDSGLTLGAARAATDSSGGDTVGEAFIYSALGMFGYMTEVSGVEVDPSCSRVIHAKGQFSPIRSRPFSPLRSTATADFGTLGPPTAQAAT